MTTTRRLTLTVLATALALTVAGCVGPPVTGASGPGSPEPTTAPEAPQPDQSTPPAAPIEAVADSCEWEAPRLDSADTTTPTAQDGELASALIGSWQHTHFDSGSGWEANTNDIRYVFPTDSTLLYCQHVPGITDHAENRAGMTLNGTVIQPPDPHPGFEVVAWSTDRMLWTNNLDGSRYLLVRR